MSAAPAVHASPNFWLKGAGHGCRRSAVKRLLDDFIKRGHQTSMLVQIAKQFEHVPAGEFAEGTRPGVSLSVALLQTGACPNCFAIVYSRQLMVCARRMLPVEAFT